MKKIVFFTFFLLQFFSFSQEEIEVTATIVPQKYFIEKIAGEKADINIMVPPGANPATYDLSTKKIKALSNSKIYFKIGYLPFELAWLDKIKNTNPSMKIVDTSKGVDLIIGKSHNHGEKNHFGVDPHIWLSPKEVKIQAKNILDAFLEIDPPNSETYIKNYEIFLGEIDNIQNFLENNFKQMKGKKLLVFHPSWGYLARDFGLEQIAIEIEGKNPTPKELKRLIDLAKKENIKVVFLQKEFPTTSANIIAQEIGGKVVYLDPLAENWHENMLYISKVIKNSLN